MARCTNCKAPLPDGSLLCSYCGDRNDLDLKGIHYHTTHETDQPRICPRCDKRLKTINLNLEGTFFIERCDQCMGLFFDPNELEALLDASVKNVFQIDRSGLDAINANRPPDQYPVSYIKCPVCLQLMNRVNFGAKSGVIVDRCKSHGVWLDGGELRHLMEWMKLGGKLLDNERQEEEKKEFQRRESERKQGVAGYQYDPSGLDGQSNPLQLADPYLFDIIISAIRYFTKL